MKLTVWCPRVEEVAGAAARNHQRAVDHRLKAMLTRSARSTEAATHLERGRIRGPLINTIGRGRLGKQIGGHSGNFLHKRYPEVDTNSGSQIQCKASVTSLACA